MSGVREERGGRGKKDVSIVRVETPPLAVPLHLLVLRLLDGLVDVVEDSPAAFPCLLHLLLLGRVVCDAETNAPVLNTRAPDTPTHSPPASGLSCSPPQEDRTTPRLKRT